MTWHHSMFTLSLSCSIECVEEFAHKSFYPTVIVTATLLAWPALLNSFSERLCPEHHALPSDHFALSVLFKARSRLSDTGCSWATSHCSGAVALGSCSLCSSPGHLLFAPSLFCKVILLTGLILHKVSLSAVCPSLSLHGQYDSFSWRSMTRLETVPKH